MSSAATIRLQVESALARKMPAALTPRPHVARCFAPTGIAEVDGLLEGGFSLGAITEMVGPESSGRTAVAFSFLRELTRAGKVCAWVDVSNALDPESAAAAGVDLCRLLWVRCGAAAAETRPEPAHGFALAEKYCIPAAAKKGLHGGGCGGHPRNEVKGMPQAVQALLKPECAAPRSLEHQKHGTGAQATRAPQRPLSPREDGRPLRSAKPWGRMEQALRVTDLLLQAGGFSAIVFDMADIAPEHGTRVPLATWFRYRAAAERTQACLLLLTQHPLSKSSGEVLLRFLPGAVDSREATVFTGIEHRLEVERRRFAQPAANVVALRKPPQSAHAASWHSQCSWAGMR